MEGALVQGGATHDERFKWLVVFAIGGDLRFLSHHDTLRLFRRALARADFPVRFTEGFNPHPKIMIPLPRPVGIASRDEALVVETTREIDPETALPHILKQTPEGFELLSLRRLVRGEQLEPQRVRYQLDVSDLEMDDLEARVERLLATT
jgi:radical SAM-linked protein